MTAHDPSFSRRKSGLLGWLGFGTAGPAPSAATLAASSEPRQATHSRQLDEIATFLGYHQLAVNALTLHVAWNYLSGSDPAIVRLIDRRIQAREPVTMEWLEDVLVHASQLEQAEALDRIMERLEAGVEEFGKTSSAARKATNDYHNALSQQADKLRTVRTTEAVITQLAGLTQAMLMRTHEIEKAMLRSEEQTRSLKRRLEETRRSAEEDHLTGLPNRRAFDSRFDAEYREARAATEPLIVAFCDIDHFKRINDVHGHDAGDRVLRLVADCLAHISNDRCHVARHGGEEFVVLFRDTTVSQAFDRLDTLRAQLAERRLVNRATDVPFGQVTFSAGIADVFASGDPRSALRAADAALYRAKQEGRNRIAIAEPGEIKPVRLVA